MAAQGRFGINVDADGGGVFIKQLAGTDKGYTPMGDDGRARLRVGQYLESVDGVATGGLSREQARALIKAVEGDRLQLRVRRPNQPSVPPPSRDFKHLQQDHPTSVVPGGLPPHRGGEFARAQALQPSQPAPHGHGSSLRLSREARRHSRPARTELPGTPFRAAGLR